MNRHFISVTISRANIICLFRRVYKDVPVSYVYLEKMKEMLPYAKEFNSTDILDFFPHLTVLKKILWLVCSPKEKKMLSKSVRRSMECSVFIRIIWYLYSVYPKDKIPTCQVYLFL